MAFLLAAYDEETLSNGEARRRAAVPPPPGAATRWPCCRSPRRRTLIAPAREVFDLLGPHYQCDYDETQAIGRRYRRQDEIGTPLLRHRRLRHASTTSAVTVRERGLDAAGARVPIADGRRRLPGQASRFLAGGRRAPGPRSMRLVAAARDLLDGVGQEVLDLGVHRAELVGGPLLQGPVQGRVDAQGVGLPRRHAISRRTTSPS